MAMGKAVDDGSEVGFGIEAVQLCALCRTPNCAVIHSVINDNRALGST
jgi:hypothetical protein